MPGRQCGGVASRLSKERRIRFGVRRCIRATRGDGARCVGRTGNSVGRAVPRAGQFLQRAGGDQEISVNWPGGATLILAVLAARLALAVALSSGNTVYI
jgi:hypothetical protein